MVVMDMFSKSYLAPAYQEKLNETKTPDSRDWKGFTMDWGDAEAECEVTIFGLVVCPMLLVGWLIG